MAAEILYERFKPMVEEQLASSPFAKVAFTVRLTALHHPSLTICVSICKQLASPACGEQLAFPRWKCAKLCLAAMA